jgi:hypothetical protein
LAAAAKPFTDAVKSLDDATGGVLSQTAAAVQQRLQDDYNTVTGQGGAATAAPQSAMDAASASANRGAAGVQEATGAPAQSPDDVLAEAAKPFTDAAKSLDDATGSALSETASAVQQTLQDDYNTLTGQGGAVAPIGVDTGTQLGGEFQQGDARSEGDPGTRSTGGLIGAVPIPSYAESVAPDVVNTLESQPNADIPPEVVNQVLEAGAAPISTDNGLGLGEGPTQPPSVVDTATVGDLQGAPTPPSDVGDLQGAPAPPSDVDAASGAGTGTGAAQARTYDDLNDDQKAYALSLARSTATLDLAGMQAVGDAARAAGLSGDQKAEVVNIVQNQDVPAIGDVIRQAQSQLWGTPDGAPTRTYDDLNDDEKTYALSLARSETSFDFNGMQAAAAAASAAGLTDLQKAQVANIVQFQDTPAISEVANDVRAQLGISQDGAQARTYDDLNDDQKAYALSLAPSMATLDPIGMQAASDAATAAGLTDAQKAQVAYILQDAMTPASSGVTGDSSAAPTFPESDFPGTTSGGGVGTGGFEGTTGSSSGGGASDGGAGYAPTFLDAQSEGRVGSDVGAAGGGAGTTFLDAQVGSDVGAAGGAADLTVPEGAAGAGAGSDPAPAMDAASNGQPSMNFEDLSDGQKNYAAQMDKAMASGSIPAVEAARDAVKASGLSDSEIAQVDHMFDYQDAESIITANKEAYAEAAIPPTRTYDDLNDAEKAYADNLIQARASGNYLDPTPLADAKASGLSDDQINEVAKIVNWQTEGPPADPYPQSPPTTNP